MILVRMLTFSDFIKLVNLLTSYLLQANKQTNKQQIEIETRLISQQNKRCSNSPRQWKFVSLVLGNVKLKLMYTVLVFLNCMNRVHSLAAIIACIALSADGR